MTATVTTSNTVDIVASVVGAVVGLCLIAAIIAGFLVYFVLLKKAMSYHKSAEEPSMFISALIFLSQSTQ